MSNLMEQAKKHLMSRRSFLGLTATLAAGTAAALTLPGCGLQKATTDQIAQVANKEGKWITAACWHNCGGRCLNKAYVVDGVVTRQKTDDTHPDSWDYPQQRGCARGRSQRRQCFGADRIKYPMKRKNWAPGGGKKDLRGQDEWVRISWDEALSIVASEIKRIKEKYGPTSLFLGGGAEMDKVLSLYGGHVSHEGTTSWGAWKAAAPAIGYGDGFNITNFNDRFDLLNSKLIVLWGANPAWSSMGNPTYLYHHAKQAGAKFIVIDPFYTETAELLGDQWIPIRPATDQTMLLAMAYTLIKEDDPSANPLIDWDFLKRCTVGFDADHQPKDADPKDNFKDYILGTYDGLPKTPEWASEICGVDPEVIKNLAREIAKTKQTAFLSGWAPARIHNGEGWVQTFVTFGCMTGHIGQPGRTTGTSAHNMAGNGGPSLVKAGGDGLPPVKNPVNIVLNDTEMWPAILNGKYTAGYQKEEKLNIQFIFHGAEANLQTRDGMAAGIEAHRKVEFVLSASHFLTTNSKYADLVLPATTQWEAEGGLLTGNREILIYYSKVTEPLYEAKSDQWMAIEVAKRLGLDPKKLFPTSEKQQLFNKLAGSMVIKEDGKTWEKLLTITPQNISQWGVNGKPQTGRITLDEYQEKGIYQVKRQAGDKLGSIYLQAFRENPEQNPLGTPSGKLEIYSKSLADLIKGRGWTEIKPYPAYVPPVEGYEDTFKDWKSKTKGDFPLQLYNPHYLRRSHSIFDNIPQLREAFPNPVFLSTQDAQSREIKTGDTVLLTSRHGKSLRIAQVTERLLPGVVALPHGAWVEIEDASGVDRAGADNYLAGAIPTGQGTSGWNSCNAQVQKWTGDPLLPDVQWPQRIIKL